MTTIVTRAGKGSPLTNNEVDTNFTNLNGAKIETLTSTDASVTITGTGSSRDLSVPINPNAVSGPASATDNAVVRFDGTTGKLIQNSTAATIDDSGNADFLSQKADFFDIDTAATTSAAVGRLRWDASKGTAVLGEVGGNLEVAVGQTLDALVTNAEAVTITKGQVVYLFSATGNRASVKLAYNTGDATSAKTFGVAAENIAANGTGLVRCVGVLDGLNLGSYTAGDTLYLGATAGSLTATKPYAPNHLVYVGLVERANNGNGQLYVRVQNGYELDEIHDVQINSGTLANGQTILYDAATSLWKNANLTAGTGVSITNGASSVTIANTGVTSLAGTANQVTASASTGAVTLSLPATINVNTSGSAATLATGRTIAITGDLAYTSPAFDGSANVTATGTLATVNTNVGTFGSSTNIPVVTVNGKGLVTAVSTASVQGGAALSNDTSTASNLYPLFAAATSGTPTTIYTSNAKYLYKPSTGELQASAMVSSNGLTVNSNTVATSYSIPSGSSAVSAGPMTVANGVSVTIPSGSRWVVL